MIESEIDIAEQSYARRFWALFLRDALAWAKEHIWWDLLFLIVPALVMLGAFHLKPDYRLIWVTVAVYFAVFVIYCLVQLAQIPGKLDRERDAQAKQKDDEVAGLRSAVAKAENAPSDPFINLLRERQRIEAELQPLLEIEECGIKVVPAIKIGKDESDYRKEKISRLRRDIKAIDDQIESLNRKPASTLPIEWKELADRFAAESRFIRADWQHGGMGKDGDQVIETWRFAGQPAAERNAEALCRMAGKLLVKSQTALAKSTRQTQTEPDDVRRWLYFLKDRGAMSYDRGYGIIEETKEIVMMGTITNLADASRIACLDCAAEES